MITYDVQQGDVHGTSGAYQTALVNNSWYRFALFGSLGWLGVATTNVHRCHSVHQVGMGFVAWGL